MLGPMRHDGTVATDAYPFIRPLRCLGVRLDRMRRALVTSKFRPWLVTLTAGAAALALPSAASPHGLPGSGAEGVLDYLWLGIRHMLAEQFPLPSLLAAQAASLSATR